MSTVLDVKRNTRNHLRLVEPVEETGVAGAVAIPDMESDRFTRHRAANFIGELAVNHEVQVAAEIRQEDRIDSLSEAISLAAEGNPAALKFLEACAKTTQVEMTLKVAHVSKTQLTQGKKGELHQNGQTLRQVQANSLLWASNNPTIRGRVEAETNNLFRIEERAEQRVLKKIRVLEWSLVDDTMTMEQLEDNDFWTDTMSLTARLTGEDPENEDELFMETAFIAGVKNPGEQRYDLKAIVALARSLNIDLEGKSVTEILATPWEIDAELVPNGVIDIVRMWDDINGTFFGQDKPRQDYLQYLEVCREREKTFIQKTKNIVRQLIAQRHEIRTLVDATTLLHHLAEKEMVEMAIENTNMDARVFGEESAGYIIQARAHRERGNIELANAATERAIVAAASSSCPGAAVGKKRRRRGGWWNKSEDSMDEDDWHGGKVYKNSTCNSCKKVKSEVGACHICYECVKNPAKREREWKEYQYQKKTGVKEKAQGWLGKILAGSKDSKPQESNVISLEAKRPPKQEQVRKVGSTTVRQAA